MIRAVLRGALVPIGRIRALETAGGGMSALAVSLGESGATHLFVLGDPLPAPLAASAISAGGRLLFGPPGASVLAEGGEPLPDGPREGFALKLKDVESPLVVKGLQRPLAQLLKIEWTCEAGSLRGGDLPRFEIRLAPSSEVHPMAGLILAGPDLRELEHRLDEYPESRFRELRFGRIDKEVLLVGTSLAGIPGEAFHAMELAEAKTLLLPLGASLYPSFAISWIAQFLDPGGDLHVWRRDRILAVDSRQLAPLTRCTWRAHDLR